MPEDLPGGFEVGHAIRVDGETDTFRVLGVGADGSLTVVGGRGRQVRSFRPEWCYPAEVRTARGARRKGRLPAERRGLRDAWRASVGFGRIERDGAE